MLIMILAVIFRILNIQSIKRAIFSSLLPLKYVLYLEGKRIASALTKNAIQNHLKFFCWWLLLAYYSGDKQSYPILIPLSRLSVMLISWCLLLPIRWLVRGGPAIMAHLLTKTHAHSISQHTHSISQHTHSISQHTHTRANCSTHCSAGSISALPATHV